MTRIGTPLSPSATKVLFLGAGELGKEVAIELQRFGIEVIALDRYEHAPAMQVAHLAQEVTLDCNDSVFDVVAGGLTEMGQLLTDYHHAASRLEHSQSDADIRRLAELQHQLEAAGGWQLEQRVETVLSRLKLDGDADFHALSGGWRRRVALGQAMVSQPDILLLVEPTNHLDIPAIEWLERQLLDYGGTVMFVTHDRSFLQRVANTIIELDRGRLLSFPGSYSAYQTRKAALLEAEADQDRKFDTHLAQEEAWIRQGIKARRTRNEGRVRRLEALREERAARRDVVGTGGLRSLKEGDADRFVH